MKKTRLLKIAFFSIIAALVLFATPAPKAEAAAIDAGRILEALSGEQVAGNIEEIVKVGKEIKEGNTGTLKNIIFKKALEEAGISSPVSEMIIENVKDIGKDIKSGSVGNTAAKAVGEAVKERVKARLSERLAPYQDKLLILATLLDQEILTPQAAKQNNKLTGAPQNYKKIINVTATAYAPGPLDNGIWNDKTYTGGKVQKGIVAVDPSIIPMGTKLYIEGYGYALADDQGSAITGNRIDLAFDKRDEALAYGIQNVKVYVLE